MRRFRENGAQNLQVTLAEFLVFFWYRIPTTVVLTEALSFWSNLFDIRLWSCNLFSSDPVCSWDVCCDLVPCIQQPSLDICCGDSRCTAMFSSFVCEVHQCTVNLSAVDFLTDAISYCGMLQCRLMEVSVKQWSWLKQLTSHRSRCPVPCQLLLLCRPQGGLSILQLSFFSCFFTYP